MEYNNEQHSCLECIWRDQCESDEVCDFFDSGRLPTDEELAIADEIAKAEYRDAYYKYISEYGDGRYDQ